MELSARTRSAPNARIVTDVSRLMVFRFLTQLRISETLLVVAILPGIAVITGCSRTPDPRNRQDLPQKPQFRRRRGLSTSVLAQLNAGTRKMEGPRIDVPLFGEEKTTNLTNRTNGRMPKRQSVHISIRALNRSSRGFPIEIRWL